MNIKIKAALVVAGALVVSTLFWWLVLKFLPVLFFFGMLGLLGWLLYEAYDSSVKALARRVAEKAQTKDAQDWTQNDA